MTNDQLRLIFWELTARCNLKCQHCRAEAQETIADGELSTAEVLQVARTIREEFDPIMVLTGGEALYRPDFFEIAEECVKLFTRVALATNGTMIDDALAQKIADVGIQRVAISFDGASPATHDNFRGVPGSFSQALAGFDALKRVGMSLQANVTVTNHNLHEVEDILTLMIDHGADAFHIFMLVPVGCGAEMNEDTRLTSEQNEELLTWLYHKSQQLAGQVHIKATCAPMYFRIMREEAHRQGTAVAKSGHGMHSVTRGCLAGSGVCFISRTGEVQPCGYLPIVVGNVREKTMAEIWNSSEVFDNLRDPETLTGKCGACSFRFVCQGCRARAFSESGDYLAEESDCNYVPPQYALSMEKANGD